MRINRDCEYLYDDPHRLIESRRGIKSGTSFTHIPVDKRVTPSQKWGLDNLGNWVELITDLDADGPDNDDAAISNEERRHNLANEITMVDSYGDGVFEITVTHDKAGNLREVHSEGIQVQEGSSLPGPLSQAPSLATERDTTLRYTHDGWNRLVKMEADAQPKVTPTLVE